MQESLEPSHNLPSDAQHLRVSILARALVHGWRHTCSAHMRVEGVAVAPVSGLDSCDSHSAVSVPRTHSSHRAAAERALRSSALRALCNRAGLVG